MTLNLVTVVCLIFTTFMVAKASDYEPLLTFPDNQPQFVDSTVNDSLRDRDIPLRVYFLQNSQAAPVILFSHGLGGSREGSGYLGSPMPAKVAPAFTRTTESMTKQEHGSSLRIL